MLCGAVLLSANGQVGVSRYTDMLGVGGVTVSQQACGLCYCQPMGVWVCADTLTCCEWVVLLSANRRVGCAGTLTCCVGLYYCKPTGV